MPALKAIRDITMALEQYREDFDAFPPDNVPDKNGSEILFYFLCRPLLLTEDKRLGPYLETPPGQTNTLLSPFGGTYSYALITGPDGKLAPLVIDPGRDKLLGGRITPTSFIPDNSNASKDNLYSTRP